MSWVPTPACRQNGLATEDALLTERWSQVTGQDQALCLVGAPLTIRHAVAQGLWLLGVAGHGPLTIAAVGMAADNQAAVPLPADILQLL